MEKQVYDPRGKQSNIGRLLGFDKEAYVHMLFYRVLIFFSLAAFVIFVAKYAGLLPLWAFEAAFIVVWVLFTPQVYETAKGASVIATEGFVHGYLNKSYLTIAKKYKSHLHTQIYKMLPYASLAIWIAGLIAILYVWFA